MARRAPEPPSPPKRVTRARTRTVAEKEEANKETNNAMAASTSITTAPKRGRPRKNTAAVEVQSKPTTKPAATDTQRGAAKRRGPKAKHVQLPVDNDSSDDEVDVVTVRTAAKPLSTKTSTSSCTRTTRTRKETPRLPENSGHSEDDDDELAQPRQHKGKVVRSRKTATLASNKGGASSTESANQAIARRGRKAANAGGSSRMKQSVAAPARTVSTRSKPTTNAPKKKVAFLDMTEDFDKENQPLPPEMTEKQKGKAALGLKAKPVRRPVTPVSRDEEQASNVKAQVKKEPLSPKKPNQLARTSPSGSSDGAFSAASWTESAPFLKTPRKSPVKLPTLRPSLASPAKKIDFNASRRLTEPIPRGKNPAVDQEDTMACGRELMSLKDSIMISTPARRPPPSPYKDSIKESPRKAPIMLEPIDSTHHQMSAALKISPLKVSAIKPKGMPIPLQWSVAPSESPIKEKKSLFQSPAKRLISPSKRFPPMLDGEHSESSVNNIGQDSCSEFRALDTQFGQKRQAESGESNSPAREDMNDDVMVDENEPMFNDDDQLQVSDMAEVSRKLDVQLSAHMEDPFISLGDKSNISTPARGYEVTSGNSSISSIRHFSGVPPPAPSPPVFTSYSPRLDYRGDLPDEESDDESMITVTPSRSPARRQSIRLVNGADSSENIGFTPLANKLSQWKPDNQERKYPNRRGMFSIGDEEQLGAKSARHSLAMRHLISQGPRITSVVTQAEETLFEGETALHEPDTTIDGDMLNGDDGNFTILEDCDEDTLTAFPLEHKVDIVEDGSEDLRSCVDENMAPQEPTITINAAFFEETAQHEPQPHSPHRMLPMSVTPVRSGPRYTRTVHTVSKVPLKSEDGSLKVPRKRTRSFSSGANSSPPSTPIVTRSKTLPSPRKARSPLKPFIPVEDEPDTPPTLALPERPKCAPPSTASSPSKSPRKQPPGHDGVLQGAVVYTDVHTKEGADASGIFVELLTQMGARCVKSWNWNPRTSLSPVDGVEPKESKVGITHVVFKDGGVRTLEKVREANGVVKCVGVNWVLDCERSNKWLDEAEYAVDISMLPRGGQKRRKSMEPRALGNVNGTVVTLDCSSSSSGSGRSSVDPETMEEFMRLSPTPTPRSSRDSSVDSDYNDSEDVLATPKPKRRPRSSMAPPETPGYSYDYDPATSMSPTTPYYLSQGAKLMQQTCPPKQLRQGLFPVDGNNEEQTESLRIRLDAARRKSLIWKPKIGSPLGRQL
ncbi:hypothetical protein CIRG_06312 [Coccidioides immitis RMSCC 2394]|nr:hypothetical protein CIRG_06312 [Coccidioides immitis RMSCC 2394]